MLLPPSFFLIFPSYLSTLLQLKSHPKFCYFCICISLSLPIILSLTFSIKIVYICHIVGRSNCNNITFHPQFILQCLHTALTSTILLISNRKVPLWNRTSKFLFWYTFIQSCYINVILFTSKLSHLSLFSDLAISSVFAELWCFFELWSFQTYSNPSI